MKELVFLQGDQPITTSLKVAQTFGKNHRDVLRDIRNLIQETASVSNERNFAPVKMFEESTYTDAKGEFRPMYLINRDGFTLLAMGFTGKKALQFKLAYINAFNKMEQQLIKILAERKSAEWLEARKLSKIELRQLTDLIRDKLIPLMIQEGASENAIRWVYKNYVSMIQKVLGIKKGTRDELPGDLLYELGKVEQMVMVTIKGLLSRGVRSSQIFLDAKQTVDSYAQISLFNQRFLIH